MLKKFIFFVVPGDRDSLLGLPDIELLNILQINCNTIGTEIEKKGTNYTKNKRNVLSRGSEQSYANIDPSPNKENDKRASANITKQIQKEFEEVNTGIGCFEGMFPLQVKPDSKSYQARCVTYALQKLVKEESKKLQSQDIRTLLGVDETVEWCNSFALVPKSNCKVRLCLDLARLNQALIRPVHRGPTLNDIFPKLNNVKYIPLIVASSGCHSLKSDDRSSYFTTFACQFGRYRHKRLPFGAAPTGDMFQHKIDEIFKDLLNVFGIADDILVVGYYNDGKDNDKTLWGC